MIIVSLANVLPHKTTTRWQHPIHVQVGSLTNIDWELVAAKLIEVGIAYRDATAKYLQPVHDPSTI